MRNALLPTVLIVAAALSPAAGRGPRNGPPRRLAARSSAAAVGLPRRANVPRVVKQLEERSYDLRAVAMVDPNTAYAVGAPHWNQSEKRYKGTIVKTTNGGVAWSSQEAGVAEVFWGVHFVDANQGWVVGENGVILHTADGGAHWARQTIATTDDFQGVAFVDPNNGWATAIRAVHYSSLTQQVDDWQASIWNTHDGGATWTKQELPASVSLLCRIDFVDSKNGWAVGARLASYDGAGAHLTAAVYHTANGGVAWTEQYSPDLAADFTAVDFVDAYNGWIGAYSTSSSADSLIYHTTDGGAHWQRQGPATTPLSHVMDLRFVDLNRGVVVDGNANLVWRTFDGGANWVATPSVRPISDALYGMAVSGGKMITVGDRDLVATHLTIWLTIPATGLGGCCVLEAKPINTHFRFSDVAFTDERHGCAVGSERNGIGAAGQVIVCTDDGGANWRTQYEYLAFTASGNGQLDRVQFTDRLNGWAVGEPIRTYESLGPAFRGGILHTTDGGATWSDQGSNLYADWDVEFGAVQFLDSSNGWALTARNYPNPNIRLAHTTDGGAHWNWVDTGVAGQAASPGEVRGGLFFRDAQHGWVAGQDAVIYTADGGAHWTKLNASCDGSTCSFAADALLFVDSLNGWIAGGNGLFRTTDGGTNWTSVVQDWLAGDLQAVDSMTGCVAGAGGTMYCTDDGGVSGVQLDTGTSADLEGLFLLNARRGWAVGDHGVILNIATDRNANGQPAVFSVLNGASYAPEIATSTWVAIFGENLAPATRTWDVNSDFAGGLLPTQLDGVRVRINGVLAYPYYISPTQLNVLVPAGVASGPVTVQVSTSAGGTSDAFVAQQGQYSPALFRFWQDEGRHAVAQIYPDYDYAGDFLLGNALGIPLQVRPAKPGETLIFYGTGFGATNPPISSDRVVAQAAPLAVPVTIRFGRVTITPQWAGMTMAGLYQFNVVVPDVPNGDQVVVFDVGGRSSQTDSVITVRR